MAMLFFFGKWFLYSTSICMFFCHVYVPVICRKYKQIYSIYIFCSILLLLLTKKDHLLVKHLKNSYHYKKTSTTTCFASMAGHPTVDGNQKSGLHHLICGKYHFITHPKRCQTVPMGFLNNHPIPIPIRKSRTRRLESRLRSSRLESRRCFLWHFAGSYDYRFEPPRGAPDVFLEPIFLVFFSAGRLFCWRNRENVRNGFEFF